MKNKAQRALLRANKQAFLQQGLVDWHLPKTQGNHHSNTPLICMAVEDPNDNSQENLDVVTAPPQLKKPPFYAVILFNDDYTPMEFVIEILQVYFALDLDRATEVMLTVHYRGRGVAGIYPRDIAETKAQQVNNYARSQGHPLLCQIEPQPE
ncbi:ATP-dependent Clp protease adapter ClpS [Alkanindiges sp. WGS2144]|uniref:ATP-dependent Clp protease adapter ClpS n=1 Tax=Alkanindiges sp. WGS2144 TaxID=3366808 RepID=UPI003753C4A8